MPYDIYIPKYKMFIEIHGQQHYIIDNYYTKTEERLQSSKKRDRMKKKYARKNGDLYRSGFKKNKDRISSFKIYKTKNEK